MSNQPDRKVQVSLSGISFNLQVEFDPFSLVQVLIVLVCGSWGGYLIWNSAKDISNARPPWSSLAMIVVAGIALSLDVDRIVDFFRRR